MDPSPPASLSAPLWVQKFGGTSVGTPERIRAVAERIAGVRRAGTSLVVVVSAMGHTTDELLTLAHQVSRSGHPPHREMDMLLSAGERIAMACLSIALADLGVEAVSFTGSQSGIITDGSHRRARIRRIRGDRVREALRAGKVAIVAGFQGVSEEREITTLGRGGSDTTAVALAAVLGAELCEIYTDVDGIYSADPRVVPGARFLRAVPADHMVELAHRGAGVLHPRSVELAQRFGVRLRVRNSFNDHEGTEIMSPEPTDHLTDNLMNHLENSRVTGVTADRGRFWVSVDLCRPTVLSAVGDRAAERNLSMLAPIFARGTLDFFAERDAEAEWKALLADLAVQGFVREYRLESDWVPLSVVGDRFSQGGEGLPEVLHELHRGNIKVALATASSLVITVGVPLTHADDGVKVLHERYLAHGEKVQSPA